MRRPLYSELRTIYETSTQNPRTFRLTIKLKDMVDQAILEETVRKTMKRYPYFCVKLVLDGQSVFFEDNPAPTPVLHTDGPIMLGGNEADGHLLAFCWWKNKVHIDVWHALTDGGGIFHLIQTFLYLYCSVYYERDLSAKGIWLEGDEILESEWEDPARKPVTFDTATMVEKWSEPAFQIFDGGIAKAKDSCIVYNIRICEEEFMRFNISKEGSPGTIIALFLSRAISSLHPTAAQPLAIALCVNQRRALRAPYAHQSLVGDAEFYVQEFHALPSTALPSCATPLTLELSAVNGSFYVNFMQFFEEEDYLRAFISQLRENNINYDVLYQESTKYPGIVCPWA